jgi:hypothetical protein
LHEHMHLYNTPKELLLMYGYTPKELLLMYGYDSGLAAGSLALYCLSFLYTPIH